MEKRNIIVIGASAGGFGAIKKLVAGLPADMPASIFIVWHMSSDVQGVLPHVLNKSQTLFAVNASDNEPIVPGRIYVAPPDHHLLIEKNIVRVTKGPKENRFRPAVDPLFRSAAHAYGNRVIGVVLSGALDDGSAGLWTVQQCGGVCIVQDPEDAEIPSMPENALRAVEADFKVPVAEMPELLLKLVNEPVNAPVPAGEPGQRERTQMEISIAMEDDTIENNIQEFGELTPYTCPECHGVLSSIREGDRVRFRCHTGHAFSADTLLLTITETIEEVLWSAIRNIHESVFLLNHMGDHFAEVNQPKLAAMYFKKAKDAESRAMLVKKAVFSHEHLHTQEIEQQAGAGASGPNGL